MHVFVLFVWVLIGINERNFSSLHTFVFFGQMKPESTFDVHDLSRSSHFVVSMWTSQIQSAEFEVMVSTAVFRDKRSVNLEFLTSTMRKNA